MLGSLVGCRVSFRGSTGSTQHQELAGQDSLRIRGCEQQKSKGKKEALILTGK